MEQWTVKELLDQAWERIDAEQAHETSGEIKREWAVAKTAIEDAQMRWTRGLAKQQGSFAPVDLEKQQPTPV